MKHIKAGYVYHYELKNFTAEDANRLDVINIAFGLVKDGAVCFPHPDALCELPRIREANSALRIVISVGGWGAGGFSPAAATKEGRMKFADSCLALAEEWKLDGIDIDWEYPGLDWAGIEASPDDKANYTALLQAVRDAFDRAGHTDWMLTVAVGCDRYFIEHTEMDKVAGILDYVSLMTYDMRGCGEPFTGHHTNLLPYTDCDQNPRGQRSVLHTVRIFEEAGVPRQKLVIGIAFYSRMWKDVEEAGSGHGLRAKAGPGDYGPGYSDILRDYMGKGKFVEYWDDDCKAPYLSDGKTFLSYDNVRSIGEKCRFVKENGLLGLMYWEHSCDATRTLLKALDDGMKEE
ncbi:MAG: glycoside hydrolase family 18 protein [Eubacteriales bacterium]